MQSQTVSHKIGICNVILNVKAIYNVWYDTKQLKKTKQIDGQRLKINVVFVMDPFKLLYRS